MLDLSWEGAGRVLALSGSLRRRSSNTALLQAAALVAPPGLRVELYPGLVELPPFNPDVEQAGAGGPAVQDFQRALSVSDAVLICCPEYAHGVPGAFKNALDWVVGSGELVGKPVGLLNASPGGHFAQASLRETLSVMLARLVPGACLELPLYGPPPEPAALAALPDLAAALRGALLALVAEVRPRD